MIDTWSKQDNKVLKSKGKEGTYYIGRKNKSNQNFKGLNLNQLSKVMSKDL